MTDGIAEQTHNTENVKRKTISGTLWSILERYSNQVISFVVMVLMARVLTPSDYGLVGMITIYIYIAQSLVDCGFSQALIRKLDRDETDNSTTFYFNIGVGIVIYLIMWFTAPLLADFYGQPILVTITRIICTAIIFNSLVVVQRTILTVNMDFKTQAKATLIANIVSGGAGIAMAYTGFGVWSIVAYQFINSSLNCIVLWIVAKWRPRLVYSWNSFKELFGFGSKLALSGFIQTLYSNAYIMVIGRVYKSADLGFYTRATQFVYFFSNNLSPVLQRVSYPVLCRYQDSPKELADKFLKFLRIFSFVMFALMMGVAGLAKPMILALLNSDWLFTAVLIQILCIGLMWHWVYSINLNILLVKGRSDLFLKLEIVKKIIFVGVLFATLPFGMKAICWGQVLNSFLEVGINSFYTRRLLGVGILKQLRVLLPSLLIGVSTGAVVYLFTEMVELNNWAELFLGMAVGISYLCAVSFLTRNYEFMELLKLAGNKLKRKSV